MIPNDYNILGLVNAYDELPYFYSIYKGDIREKIFLSDIGYEQMDDVKHYCQLGHLSPGSQYKHYIALLSKNITAGIVIGSSPGCGGFYINYTPFGNDNRIYYKESINYNIPFNVLNNFSITKRSIYINDVLITTLDNYCFTEPSYPAIFVYKDLKYIIGVHDFTIGGKRHILKPTKRRYDGAVGLLDTSNNNFITRDYFVETL